MTERETEIRAWVKGRENMPWAGTDPAADLLQLLDDARRERDEAIADLDNKCHGTYLRYVEFKAKVAALEKERDLWKQLHKGAILEVDQAYAKVSRLEAALRNIVENAIESEKGDGFLIHKDDIENGDAALSGEQGEKEKP